MDIAITGASGLIGQALTTSLRSAGHHVIPLVRSGNAPGSVRWDPEAGTIDAAGLEGVDGVVHLAGEGIASGRWSDAQRDRIRASRERGTQLLATTLAELQDPPSVLVSGSAIGYYGSRGDEVLPESAAPGDDFLAGVCLAWEAATAPAEAAGIRTVHIRTGIVLDAGGGALGKQLLAFKLGLGAKAGSGRQWMSWITLHDEVRAIRFALEEAGVSGALNLTAPNPVTNADFTDAVGDALHRPTFLTIPAFIRKAPLGVGGLVESLLLVSQRCEPAALLAAGFTFDHEDLDTALEAVLPHR